MNKKNIIQTALIIVITAAFAVYIKKNSHHIKEALAIRPSLLASLILLNVLNKVCLGLKTKKIMELFSIKLSFTEWLGSSIVNNFYNYLAPKSGTTVVGVYLKNKHGLSYNKYMAVLITTGLITILSSGIVGIFVIIFFYSSRLLSTVAFLIMFSGMVAGPLVIFRLPRINLVPKRIFEKFEKFFEGWHVLHKSRKTILFLFSMDICTILLMAWRYFILFKMFSLAVSFAPCVLLSPFNIITHFATFVPGAYGIKEAAVGAVSTLTNISFASGALATLSDRIIMMTLTFILGPIFSFILLKHSFSGKKPA